MKLVDPGAARRKVTAMPVSPVISESVSRTARKRARNRAALIASARRLFAQVGFEATTIAAIAESADLGFGTFYRYFPDKVAILTPFSTLFARNLMRC